MVAPVDAIIPPSTFLDIALEERASLYSLVFFFFHLYNPCKLTDSYFVVDGMHHDD